MKEARTTRRRQKKQRELPPGWRWVRLGKSGRFDSGGTPSKSDPAFWGGNIPFVTGADITDLYISAQHARAFLTEKGLLSGRTAICQPGTVLLVTRTRVGRVGIASKVMGASQDLSPYICGPDLYPEFVARYIQSISDYLIENCRGATIQGLTRDFVNKLQIPLPPLPEQRRIAAILNEQIAAVDQARAAVEAQLAAAQALPAAYLRQVFDGPEASDWPRKKLGEIVLSGPQNGVFKRRSEFGQGVPIVNVSDLYRSLAVDLSQAERVSVTDDELDRYGIAVGDLFFCRSSLKREGIGWCCYARDLPEPAVFECHVMRVGVKPSAALPEYIAYYWQHPAVRSFVIGNSRTATMTTMNQKDLVEVPLLLPPLSEQRRIAVTLREQAAAVEDLRVGLETQLAEINALPSALLRRAFNGEL